MNQVYSKRIFPKETKELSKRTVGQVLHRENAREVGIENAPKEDAHEDCAKPGKDRKIIHRIETTRYEAQPEQPGKVEGLIAKQDAQKYGDPSEEQVQEPESQERIGQNDGNSDQVKHPKYDEASAHEDPSDQRNN